MWLLFMNCTQNNYIEGKPPWHELLREISETKQNNNKPKKTKTKKQKSMAYLPYKTKQHWLIYICLVSQKFPLSPRCQPILFLAHFSLDKPIYKIPTCWLLAEICFPLQKYMVWRKSSAVFHRSTSLWNGQVCTWPKCNKSSQFRQIVSWNFVVNSQR